MAQEVVQRWAFSTDPFGEPSVISANNADAVWSRGHINSTFQKSSTGWLANLYGGIQTNDDWAAVYIPVNEMKLPSFASAKWTYFMTSTQTMGVNIVIWAHDPTDLDKRAEITQLGGHADLEKGAGWNAFEFKNSTGGMFYYGENISGSGLTAGTQYTWLEFLTDAVFKTWKIYRISIEYGWEAAGTFADVWVGEIILDGKTIPLRPDSGGTGRIGRRHFTVASGDLTGTLAPKTPFRLLSVDLHVTAAPNAGEAFTITKDAGQGVLYDTLIYSNDIGTAAVTSLYQTFEGIESFGADDELDIFHTNSQDDDYGVTLTYQTVF
ncbi:hypothetical protein LCGC14_2630080 [marine sediment metagenome]|uniref:Uncharacterized protein n=1 Tax=marine sediment metagenome TaxID=412755 RepID=A0A0F9CSY0_9ZZZZ